MKFGKNFSFYKIPEYSEYYFDYYSMKLFLKFIDNRRNKKKGLKKLQSLRHKLSENDIQMNYTIEETLLKKLNHQNLIIMI